MNTKIAFVLDSTTIIPEECEGKFVYEVVPLHVTVDGVNKPEPEFTDEEIVSRLETSKDLKSSSPSIGEFEVAYKKLFDQGFKDIIVITLSKENSATYQVAKMAIDLLPDEQKSHVFVPNTLINNFGLSNVVSAMTPLLDLDIEAADLANRIQTYTENSRLMFTILDLKHLVRGGRLSKLAGAFGILFKIKPIIEMIEGKLQVTHKKRTAADIITYFISQLAIYAAKHQKVYVRLVYLGEENKQHVETLIDSINKAFKNVVCTVIERVGPVFLVHLGNSGFGISVTGTDDQQ